MPELKSYNTFTLTLPTTKHLPEEDQAVLTIKKTLNIGDALLAGELDTESKEDVFNLYAKLIESWNFTENGIPVPINGDTVKRLDQLDFEALGDAIREAALATEDKKKSDSLSLGTEQGNTGNSSAE